MRTRKKEILTLKNQTTHASVKLTFCEQNDLDLTYAEVLHALEQAKRETTKKMYLNGKNYKDTYGMIDI